MDAYLRAWSLGSSGAATSVPSALVSTQSKLNDDLTVSSELGLLLTGAPTVKREAEDLTARRSPERPEDRRVIIVNNALELGKVEDPSGSPGRYTVQQPVALLHADSPSPKDMSTGHYTAQYTGLAPAQVFTDSISQYSGMPPSPTASYGQSGLRAAGTGTYAVAAEPYYRDYYPPAGGDQYGVARAAPVYAEGQEGHAQFVERYIRPGSAVYKMPGQGLTVDLPSPDSGIGAEATTPRDQSNALQQTTTGFEYADMCGGTGQQQVMTSDPSQLRPGASPPAVSRSRPWHDFGRQTEVDKIHIPKILSNYGFRFYLETPISTSQRREDDRLTYVNKGQFYGVTMEYVPDADKPLKNTTVKSVVLLVFREEKTPEDEMKAWQFWHSRQHSVKQRILDVDTKNSLGLYGGIDELSHNAIAVYWNPLESSGKINIAVQCLSTDFSSQKGVKGLPLHIQIDTYEDYRDPNAPVSHRAYCQVKSFCDKGAERKTRDEERRASKRKMTATGRKKMEEMYHGTCERSEFYSMVDTTKPPTLFQPSDDPEKIGNMELQNYYAQQDSEGSLCAEAVGSPVPPPPPPPLLPPPPHPAAPATLKFHYSFPAAPAEAGDGERKPDESLFSPGAKRARLSPPLSQRVMLYVRQEREELYTPLHVVPPTTLGLLHAIESKYKLSASCAQTLCRKNKKGVIATMDDDMIAHYCNEDTFLLEIRQGEQEGAFEITLIEVGD